MLVMSSAIMALFAIAAQVVVAGQPPACVLAAINTQPEISDFKKVCGSKEVASYLTKNCGDNLKAAQSYFEDVCKDNGHEVDLSGKNNDHNSSSSSKKSASATATASGTRKASSAATSATTSAASSHATSAATSTASSHATSAASSDASSAASSATQTAFITGGNTYGTSDSAVSATGTSATGSAATGSSATGSAAASPTGAASGLRLGMDVLGMAALLSFGAMLAL